MKGKNKLLAVSVCYTPENPNVISQRELEEIFEHEVQVAYQEQRRRSIRDRLVRGIPVEEGEFTVILSESKGTSQSASEGHIRLLDRHGDPVRLDDLCTFEYDNGKPAAGAARGGRRGATTPSVNRTMKTKVK